VTKIFIPVNRHNYYIKRLLSDGFNMTAIENYLKSHSSQMLACTL